MKFQILSALWLLFIYTVAAINGNEASQLTAEIIALSSVTSDNIIDLDATAFERIVLSKDREFSILVCFTVISDDYQCEPCRRFEPDFTNVAYSVKLQEAELQAKTLSKVMPVYFAKVDFISAREVFEKLQIVQVPIMKLYKAKSIDAEQYDFPKEGVGAEKVAKWLSSKIGHSITIHEPTDYKMYFKIAIMAAGAITFFIMVLPVIQRGLANRRFWAALSIVSCLMFTSGYVWNSIRGPSFVGGGKVPEYIAGGFQNQFGIETQIMAVLYSLCAFAVVNLITRVPNVSNPNAQRTAVYMSLMMIIGIYSVIMYLFRRKYGGYPFRLLI